jgi:hypothetical protein
MLAGDPTTHNEVSEALLRFPINGDDGEVSPLDSRVMISVLF